MKTLLLLRHAKSSHDQIGVNDHDRVLNGRGEKDAPQVGKRLKRERLVLDAVVSSTAVRAKELFVKLSDAESVQEGQKFEAEIIGWDRCANFEAAVAVVKVGTASDTETAATRATFPSFEIFTDFSFLLSRVLSRSLQFT